MRTTVDKNHEELERVLADLLAADIDITVREVARRHPSLKNASAFTRSEGRIDLIRNAQKTQAAARCVQSNPLVKKAATLSEQLEKKSARVNELERQVRCLVAAHLACVRAVMQHGGMRSLQRYWNDYSEVLEVLKHLEALPTGAQVIQLVGKS